MQFPKFHVDLSSLFPVRRFCFRGSARSGSQTAGLGGNVEREEDSGGLEMKVVSWEVFISGLLERSVWYTSCSLYVKLL